MSIDNSKEIEKYLDLPEAKDFIIRWEHIFPVAPSTFSAYMAKVCIEKGLKQKQRLGTLTDLPAEYFIKNHIAEQNKIFESITTPWNENNPTRKANLAYYERIARGCQEHTTSQNRAASKLTGKTVTNQNLK